MHQGFLFALFTLSLLLGGCDQSPEATAPAGPENIPAATVLTDDSGHNHWANSRALLLMGIDNNTADPAGGKIVRDLNTGEPNGVLEEASALVNQAIPPWTLEQYTSGAACAVEQANRYGVAGMKDASASAKEVEAFYTIDQNRGLTVHVATALYVESKDDINAVNLDEFIRLRDKFRSAHVHTDFVKLFLDGVPTASRSAAMLAPTREARTSPGIRAAISNINVGTTTAPIVSSVKIVFSS